MRRVRPLHLAVAVAVAGALVLSACGGATEDTIGGPLEDVPGAGGDAAPDALQGEWLLTDGTAPDGEVPTVGEDGQPIGITLTVDGAEWSARVCNHLFADVAVDGDRLTVSGVGGTEMGCLDGQVTTAEARFSAAWSLVDRWAVADDTLTLTGPDVQLRFTRPEPVADRTLTGTVWRLETVIAGETASSVPVGPPDTAVSDDAEVPSLRIGDDATFEAFTGCRTVRGAVDQLEDGTARFRIEDAGDACDDPSFADLDEHHLAVLSGEDADVEIVGELLTIAVGDRGLMYRAEPAAG